MKANGSQLELHALAGKETPEERRQALREASRQFEAIFIQQMIAAMRKTVGDGGLIRKGVGEQVFEGMLDEEWAKKLAGKTGPNGLGELLYRQLSHRLEQSS
jgi:flagellar protein FlgJ